LIANILNGEGYSNLKQVVKENVKVVLSENKKLISISFVALIQTIKADPQMVKIIQDIPGANGGEQHNYNITKYFEFNKDRILDLSEKNYNNLVEALTDNTIDTAAAPSSSTATLQLPSHSSLTFPSPFDQSDTYRREKSESFHHSKGDIAD
jgi:hypothetical protein